MSREAPRRAVRNPGSVTLARNLEYSESRGKPALDRLAAEGLRFTQVEADTGNIGGSESHEFMVLADTGEDAILSCPECHYGANVEKAETGALPAAPAWPLAVPDAPEEVDTPDQQRQAAVHRKEGEGFVAREDPGSTANQIIRDGAKTGNFFLHCLFQNR